MKLKLIFVGVGCGLFCAFGAVAKANGNDQSKFTIEKLTQRDTEALRGELCMILTRAAVSDGYDAAGRIEGRLLKYSGVSTSAAGYRKELAEFWNANNSQFFCEGNNGTYPLQHFYKRVFAMNLQLAVIEDYFAMDEVSFPIDFNAIEISANGERSTLIDYLDSIISTNNTVKFNLGVVIGIREIIVDLYGAKAVSDLSVAECKIRTNEAMSAFNKPYSRGSVDGKNRLVIENPC